jgi:predicted DNA-binding ribbon-helix-helix protein
MPGYIAAYRLSGLDPGSPLLVGAEVQILSPNASSHRPVAGPRIKSGATEPTPYHPPVKRSIEIAGHKTSISLEPLFWNLLRAAAEAEDIPVNALVARIDAERILATSPPGLAGAIRLWLAARLGEETIG